MPNGDFHLYSMNKKNCFSPAQRAYQLENYACKQF